jgi:hypothetical protein
MPADLSELIVFLEDPAFGNIILRTEITNNELFIVLQANVKINSIRRKVEQITAEMDRSSLVPICYVYDNGRIAYP